ncbi:MAG: hypothetical protein WCX14_05620 [Dysgonamonadaceae bacterium]|jgi:hypothetical protein
MKNKYIESLLNEIQELESKVIKLKENQSIPFSFFKEAFKQTQEIMRLLHTLEFVQIEDMKSQMEKLVQFLSEASEQTESSEKEKKESYEQDDKRNVEAEKQSVKEEVSPSEPLSSSKKISKEKIKEDFPLSDEKDSETKSAPLISESINTEESDFVKESATDDSHINPLHAANKSLNDMQPTNHTIMDSKRSISLNDRFLFQRELFNNDRQAMNNMMIKMQSFATFAGCKNYLENNTDWDFKDETVEKFLDLLKEGF